MRDTMEPPPNRSTKMSRTDTWGVAVADHTHTHRSYPIPTVKCFSCYHSTHNVTLIRPPLMCVVFLGRTKCALQCLHFLLLWWLNCNRSWNTFIVCRKFHSCQIFRTDVDCFAMTVGRTDYFSPFSSVTKHFPLLFSRRRNWFGVRCSVKHAGDGHFSRFWGLNLSFSHHELRLE